MCEGKGGCFLCMCVCVNFSPSLPATCSVWSGRPVQTARADSCLDWAGASRPLTPPQQRQVRAFSWLSSHSPLTTQRHTTVYPSLLSHTHTQLGFSNVVLRNYNYSKFSFCFCELQAITWRLRVMKPGLQNFWTKETKKMFWDKNQPLIRNIITLYA